MKPSSFGMSGLGGRVRHPKWPPEMSPLLRFFLIYSFLECYNFCIWLFTALGFAPLLWTFCVVPFLVVYWLCDHSKLWQAVREIKRSRNELLTISCAFISIFFNRMPWGLFLGCVFCLFKAFSFEKMMYMSDLYGEIVKSIFWKVASRLVEIKETNRLSWKGGLAYCSPYSRKLVQIKTDCYYTLKPGPAPDQKSPENYTLEFNIEACRVVCKYSTGGSKDLPHRKGEESNGVKQSGAHSDAADALKRKGGLSTFIPLTSYEATTSNSPVNDFDTAIPKDGILSRSPSFTSHMQSRSPSFSMLSGSPPLTLGSSPVNVPAGLSRTPSLAAGILSGSPSSASGGHSRSPSLTSGHSRSFSLNSGAQVFAPVSSQSPSHSALSRSPSLTSVGQQSGSPVDTLSRSASGKSGGHLSAGLSTEQETESAEKQDRDDAAAAGAYDESSPSEDQTSEPESFEFSKIQVQKLEASIWHGGEIIEGYTHYQVEPEAVMEVKRVLEILRDQGNLIFSDVHRNIGSRIFEAHARCYEFDELLYLIIQRGYRLHMVKLLGTYTCYISGTHVLVDAIGVALTIFILYYQLSKAPKPIFYVLLGLYIFWQLFQIAMHQGGHKEICLEFDVDILARRCLYHLIKAIADPDKMPAIYGWLHEKLPFLTFGNESYGHPYSATGQQEVCLLFVDQCRALPIVNSSDYELILKKDLPPPLATQSYDLKNLLMEMTLRRGDPTRENEWKVEILMLRNHEDKSPSYWYRRIFVTDGGRVSNLIAIMEWLVKNDCLGVCKEWPEKNRMHAYPYLELFTKVLVEGVQPWIIIIPATRVDLTIE